MIAFFIFGVTKRGLVGEVYLLPSNDGNPTVDTGRESGVWGPPSQRSWAAKRLGGMRHGGTIL